MSIRRQIFHSLLFAAFCLSVPGPGWPFQPAAAERELLRLRAIDGRVATIGHRLAVANAEFCAALQWRHGMVFIDLADVARDYRLAVNLAFGAQGGLGISALAADGPAARAGLRAGDVLLAIDGEALDRQPRQAIDRMLSLIDTAFADGIAEIAVRRSGAALEVTVRAEQGCPTRFEVSRSRRRQGLADGNVVRLTLGLVNYAGGDAELAAVLGHEFAHNVLGHRVRLDAAGVKRGFFGNFGRSAREIRATEVEADRLGVYLMERAGYDPAAMARFWLRFGRSGLNLFGSSTHPNWRSRIATVEQEIAAIRAARAAGRVPRPMFLPAR